MSRLKTSFSRKKEENMERDIPQEIIIRILSFLPTTDAIRTSLVSPAWTHLWKSVTSLSFDGGLFQSQTRFKTFLTMVYRATLVSNSSLDSYTLTCSYSGYDMPTDFHHMILHQCIAAAIKRNVQNLQINYMSGHLNEPVMFFSPLYDGVTTHCINELNLRTPYRFSIGDCKFLSAVTTLRLYEITLDSISSELRLTFPVLEELSLIQCKWKNARVVNVYAPMLRNFTKEDDESKGKCKIRIHGASIKKIEYAGTSLSGYDLGDVSSVTDADIHLSLDQNDENERRNAMPTCRFLTQFSAMKNLTLSTNTIEVLSRVADLERRIPAYSKAIRLTIRQGVLPLHFQTLVRLLQIFPVESLMLNSGVPIGIDNFEFNGAKLVYPLPHLKVVKFEVFNGNEREIVVAKYLVKYAPNLVKVSTLSGTDLKYCLNKKTRMMSPEEHAAKRLLKEKFNRYDAIKHFVIQFLNGICWCFAFTFLVAICTRDK